VVIRGTVSAGVVKEVTIAPVAGETVSSGVAFATIYSITLPPATAEGQTIDIGYSNALELPGVVDSEDDVLLVAVAPDGFTDLGDFAVDASATVTVEDGVAFVTPTSITDGDTVVVIYRTSFI
jgi:hypothetical protein